MDKKFFYNSYIFGYPEKYYPEKLEKPKVKGKDTRNGRFVLVWSNDKEKEYYMKILGIDGKKVIYSFSEMNKEKK